MSDGTRSWRAPTASVTAKPVQMGESCSEAAAVTTETYSASVGDIFGLADCGVVDHGRLFGGSGDLLLEGLLNRLHDFTATGTALLAHRAVDLLLVEAEQLQAYLGLGQPRDGGQLLHASVGDSRAGQVDRRPPLGVDALPLRRDLVESVLDRQSADHGASQGRSPVVGGSLGLGDQVLAGGDVGVRRGRVGDIAEVAERADRDAGLAGEQLGLQLQGLDVRRRRGSLELLDVGARVFGFVVVRDALMRPSITCHWGCTVPSAFLKIEGSAPSIHISG